MSPVCIKPACSSDQQGGGKHYTVGHLPPPSGAAYEVRHQDMGRFHTQIQQESEPLIMETKITSLNSEVLPTYSHYSKHHSIRIQQQWQWGKPSRSQVEGPAIGPSGAAGWKTLCQGPPGIVNSL